jgi:hypothetical protein
LLTLLAYSDSFTTGFALDSQVLLLGDSRIQKATAENVGLILRHTYWWPNGEAGIYRPFTTLTYLFNYAILGNADRPAFRERTARLCPGSAFAFTPYPGASDRLVGRHALGRASVADRIGHEPRGTP